MSTHNNTRYEYWKERLAALLVIGWTSFVCGCYVYYYLTDVYDGYPVLHELRQLGLLGIIHRILTP